MNRRCVLCGGNLVEKKNAKIMIDLGNPIQIPVETREFEECERCGDRLFDEKESLRIAEIVDNTMKKSDIFKVPVGSKVEIVDKQ